MQPRVLFVGSFDIGIGFKAPPQFSVLKVIWDESETNSQGDEFSCRMDEK
jgi:hypothetical protein